MVLIMSEKPKIEGYVWLQETVEYRDKKFVLKGSEPGSNIAVYLCEGSPLLIERDGTVEDKYI